VCAYGVLSGCFRLRHQHAVAVHGEGIKFRATRIRTPHTLLGTHTTFQHPIPRSGCHGRGEAWWNHAHEWPWPSCQPKTNTATTTCDWLPVTVPVAFCMGACGGVGITSVPNTAWDRHLGPPALMPPSQYSSACRFPTIPPIMMLPSAVGMFVDIPNTLVTRSGGDRSAVCA
jgi:hypothetical protein